MSLILNILREMLEYFGVPVEQLEVTSAYLSSLWKKQTGRNLRST
ncbi:MTFR2 isoform 6 [Pan troglodytes]|uniref:MTFR2 isoform 6 n=2 Tax=Homininae TaxID=207598 RepID=A0A2J8PSR6_PANTR|nr:MTFR2 isoform 6 [Pan troglodytes]